MNWIQKLVTSMVQRKGFSLLPMAVGNQLLRGQARPDDYGLLRAFEESPFVHLKLHRQCSAFAMLPFKVYARDGRSGELDLLTEDHPLWRLLRAPNPMLTGWDFRFLSELYVRTQGEVYWRLMRTGFGRPEELWVYPRQWVRPIYDRLTHRIAEYRVRLPFDTAREQTVSPVDMLWLRTASPIDPYSKGVGDVLAFATEIDTYELASESNRRFFQNDAQPAGALIIPGSPTPDEVNRIRDDWQKKVGGPEGSGSVPILSGGMAWKQFRQSHKDMDYVEGQRFLRDTIIAGTHKHILGISDDVTFANAKAADYTWGKWDFSPRITWWESSLNSLLSPQFDARAFVKWDNPVPADEAFELDKAKASLVSAAITRNEYRRAMGYEELPPEQGDVFLVPLSTIEQPSGRESARRQAAGGYREREDRK